MERAAFDCCVFEPVGLEMVSDGKAAFDDGNWSARGRIGYRSAVTIEVIESCDTKRETKIHIERIVLDSSSTVK